MNQLSSASVERQAARVLEELLGNIPSLTLDSLEREPARGRDRGVDIIADATHRGKRVRFLVEVKGSGQPRVVREAARQLRHYAVSERSKSVLVVMAPYLSDRAREACSDEGVGYADLQGNAHIVFDTVYIDRQVAGRPDPDRRGLRSLFKPKSARLLRCLLRDPRQTWRVGDLARAADVSIGLASTVGTALRERGWLLQTGEGISLSDPDDLLDHWAEHYEPPKGEQLQFYTHLHGKALIAELKRLPKAGGRAALSGFSAADWLAPFVRQSTTSLYADEDGLHALEDLLDLRSVEKGANVAILVPDEEGVLDDALPAATGLLATSPVQTYLDLMSSGERGREGAAHLRAGLLKWT